MEGLDLETQTLLFDIYEQLYEKDEISIGAPIYDKTQVDILVDNKLIQIIDASSLEGWGYIVRSSYQGKKYIEEMQDSLYYKIRRFVIRGEEIEKKETQDAVGISTVSGPLFNAWIDEIKVFNDRNLKNHPLHDSINSTCFHKKNIHAYPDMMGHLRALLADKELFENDTIPKVAVMTKSKKSFEQMLAEDIEQCDRFLENMNDTEKGLELYIDITGKYDAIIPNFGHGLYCYSAH